LTSSSQVSLKLPWPWHIRISGKDCKSWHIQARRIENRQRQKEEEKQQKLATQQLKTDARMQKQQGEESEKQTRVDKRARKGASKKEKQEASAGPSVTATADLQEAPQPPERPATTS